MEHRIPDVFFERDIEPRCRAWWTAQYPTYTTVHWDLVTLVPIATQQGATVSIAPPCIHLEDPVADRLPFTFLVFFQYRTRERDVILHGMMSGEEYRTQFQGKDLPASKLHPLHYYLANYPPARPANILPFLFTGVPSEPNAVIHVKKFDVEPRLRAYALDLSTEDGVRELDAMHGAGGPFELDTPDKCCMERLSLLALVSYGITLPVLREVMLDREPALIEFRVRRYFEGEAGVRDLLETNAWPDFACVPCGPALPKVLPEGFATLDELKEHYLDELLDAARSTPTDYAKAHVYRRFLDLYPDEPLPTCLFTVPFEAGLPLIAERKAAAVRGDVYVSYMDMPTCLAAYTKLMLTRHFQAGLLEYGAGSSHDLWRAADRHSECMNEEIARKFYARMHNPMYKTPPSDAQVARYKHIMARDVVPEIRNQRREYENAFGALHDYLNEFMRAHYPRLREVREAIRASKSKYRGRGAAENRELTPEAAALITLSLRSKDLLLEVGAVLFPPCLQVLLRRMIVLHGHHLVHAERLFVNAFLRRIGYTADDIAEVYWMTHQNTARYGTMSYERFMQQMIVRSIFSKDAQDSGDFTPKCSTLAARIATHPNGVVKHMCPFVEERVRPGSLVAAFAPASATVTDIEDIAQCIAEAPAPEEGGDRTLERRACSTACVQYGLSTHPRTGHLHFQRVFHPNDYVQSALTYAVADEHTSAALAYLTEKNKEKP